MHARWLTAQKFVHPAHQIVFQDQIEAINTAQARLAGLEQQLRDIVPTWTMVPVVKAYQALRGVSFLVTATFVSEVGDVRRFTIQPVYESDQPSSGAFTAGAVHSNLKLSSMERGGRVLLGGLTTDIRGTSDLDLPIMAKALPLLAHSN